MSLKRYFHRSTTMSPLQKINQIWNNFINFHSSLCEFERNDSMKPATAYSEIKALSQIADILIEEDSLDAQIRTLRPCLEFLITSRVFEILTAAAQIDMPGGLFLIVIKMFTKILKKIKNQDLVSQMSFHSSLSSLLHILFSIVSSSTDEMKIAVIKMIKRLLERIKDSSAHMDLFISNYEKRAEFLPLSILMLYFNDQNFYKYDKTPFIMMGKITDESLLRIIIKDHEFTLNLVTKLSFYFQIREVNAIKIYAAFLEEFYSNCISKTFKEEIVDAFYETFCAPILTPRLQSNDYSTRINASILLTIVVQEITSVDVLIPIVYFFQGKAKDGSKRLKPLVNTPTSSQKKTFEFNIDPNKGCKPISDISKMWDTLIDNLNSKFEQLSIYTLRILYYLLNQGGKKIVKLLITDYFSGCPPTGDVCMTADIFISLIPPKILPKDLNRNLNEYLQSAYLRCSSAVKSSTIQLEEFSEYTGSSSYKYQLGETGGTDLLQNPFINSKEKFFEGEILHVVLMKFKNFLQNSIDENLYITGIISTLSTFPKEKGSFSVLHNFLLEPQTSSKDNFLTYLKQLAIEIDSLAIKDDNFNEKLMNTIQEMGVPIKVSASDTFYEMMFAGRSKNKKSKSLQVEDKRYIEAIVVFQEFVKEMCSILIYKEVLDDMANRARADDEENC
ncbi:hypothetical protein SteCoe_6442 [Stentor coeruleus]|uniref:FHF complex subunit HOOK-interacting protein C-terminal domain-containing protein n=1 Tax=Stentor coeruleus TaxID=5963 RepID=A0A1R2CQ08_9CILI|nr:hypothetical protein SteCoe_6442 [Stentor coeruleus]